jgi:hypothetical protein
MQFSLAGMGTGGRCGRESSGRKKGIKGIKEKVVKQIRILLYREIVTICFERRTEHINKGRSQNTGFSEVKTGDAYTHCYAVRIKDVVRIGFLILWVGSTGVWKMP